MLSPRSLIYNCLILTTNLQHGATLYTIQLAFNFAFTPIFFGLRRPIEGTINIVTLTSLVAYLTYTWGQVDSVAGWCLAPYIGWLSFATYLSVSI